MIGHIHAAVARLQALGLVAPRTFVAAALLFASHRLLLVACPPYAATWFRGYFGDFLALMICVPFFASTQGWLRVRCPGYQLSAAEIAGYWLLFSLWFEGVAPLIWSHQTRDPGDVLAYGLGGIFLWVLEGGRIWPSGWRPRHVHVTPVNR
jgi:hypothetical protein